MTQTTACVRLSEGGRILIPARLRAALGMKEGDAIVLELDGDGLRLRTYAQSLERALELAAPYASGPSMAEELLAERRAESRAEADH
jgi:AbrB family looped-hinge helix DNA binding protein